MDRYFHKEQLYSLIYFISLSQYSILLTYNFSIEKLSLYIPKI